MEDVDQEFIQQRTFSRVTHRKITGTDSVGGVASPLLSDKQMLIFNSTAAPDELATVFFILSRDVVYVSS